MRNGIKDTFEMSGIAKSLDKIVKLKKKYDNKQLLIQIDSNISVEFSKHFTTCYIKINNTRAIKYSYGAMSGVVMGVATAATFGLARSSIRFITSDKTIANHKFIKSLSQTLKDSLPSVEDNFKLASKEKWNV